MLRRLKRSTNEVVEEEEEEDIFLKSCVLRSSVVKYCRAGQTTDGNMAHALCMLDT
jgi:hypothetical protein